MFSIILTGHGGCASGMETAVTQIMGQPLFFSAVDFLETMNTETLEKNCTKQSSLLKRKMVYFS